SPPQATPAAETSPARRPRSTLCVTMYVTAGPGTTISAIAATQKTARVDAVGIAQPYTRPDVAEDAHRRRTRARRRARARRGAVPRRRQHPRVPRVLRAARGADDDRRAADERAARVHEHAVQAALRLPAEGRRRRVGLAPRRAGGRRRVRRPRLQ